MTSLPEGLDHSVGGQPYVSADHFVAYGLGGGSSRLAQLCADARRATNHRLGLDHRYQPVLLVPVVAGRQYGDQRNLGAPAGHHHWSEQPERRSVLGLHQPGLQRSEEHTSELQSLAYLVCRLLLEKKKN